MGPSQPEREFAMKVEIEGGRLGCFHSVLLEQRFARPHQGDVAQSAFGASRFWSAKPHWRKERLRIDVVFGKKMSTVGLEQPLEQIFE
jgi:hypothetical protein